MSQTASIQLPYNAERIKYYSDGANYPDITINGSGFGQPPNIVFYRDWSRSPAGVVSLVNNMIGEMIIVGASIPPNIVASQGRNGLAHRQGGTDAATTNQATQAWAILSSPKKNIRIGYGMSTPAGRSFSGTDTPGVFPSPAASVLKPVWAIDTTEGGSDGRADVVIGSWTGANFAMLGNTCPYNLAGTSSYDFNGWNYFQGSSVAGADPFADNGVITFTCSNAISNTTVNTKTNSPAFGAGAAAAQYDRISFFGWSGNGTAHNNSLHVQDYIYWAAANDANVDQRIELMDNATFSNATKHRLIPYKTWSDTQIKFTKMPHYVDQGFTHYRITAGANSIVGAL